MYSTSQTLLLVLTFIIVEPVNMPTAMAVICNEASVKDFNHDELKWLLAQKNFPPNNKDLETSPVQEYEYVVHFDPTVDYPCGAQRQGGTLSDFLRHAKAKKARLTKAEVLALRLYSVLKM